MMSSLLKAGFPVGKIFMMAMPESYNYYMYFRIILLKEGPVLLLEISATKQAYYSRKTNFVKAKVCVLFQYKH